MYTFLPDELVKEILAPSLQVPDKSFASTSAISPFSSNPSHTSLSAYLLVCKDWLRVATPLLYSVVVLRSRAQVQALEYAVETTPVLAGFIKKLRVESGYCGSLYTILRAVKNLTDLCLSLEVYSSDNVASICKGLYFVNPTRLIVFDPHMGLSGAKTNQKAQQFIQTIYSSIEKWDNLKKVVLPSWYYVNEPKYGQFALAICSSKTVEVVSIVAQQNYTSWIDRLVKSPNIKTIIVRNPFVNGTRSPFIDRIAKSSSLKEIIQWGEEGLTSPLVPAGPTPRARAVETETQVQVQKVQKNWLTDFPDDVWTNIFFFTLGLDIFEQGKSSKLVRSIDWEYYPGQRRGLAFVCKKFFILVKPLYFRCIIIYGHHDLEKLITYLCRNVGNARDIKTLFTIDKGHFSDHTQYITQLVAEAENLERVSTMLNESKYYTGSFDIFDWNALSMLALNAGPRLVDLDISLHRPTQHKPPDLFYQFSVLKHLGFSSSCKFDFDRAKVNKGALKTLESLACTSINNTFLSFMSCLDLPNLQRVHFPVLDKSEGAITFLRKHGSKLHTLELGFLPGVSVFDICPNLEKFIVPQKQPGFGVAEFFSSSDEHSLRTLHITTKDVPRGAEKERFKYLGNIELTNFTSLHEIQVDNCIWPTTENEIKKSHWAAWAERLQQLCQVEMLDKDGRKWVPRLKAKSVK